MSQQIPRSRRAGSSRAAAAPGAGSPSAWAPRSLRSSPLLSRAAEDPAPPPLLRFSWAEAEAAQRRREAARRRPPR